jgi:cytochrome c peroxidase
LKTSFHGVIVPTAAGKVRRNEAMKKNPVLIFSLALLFGAALCSAAFAETRADAAARGAKLFADTGLGANGKSCASCHSDGKGWAG